MKDYDRITEELLDEACYVIDFLPEQVPAGADGRFSDVESLFLREPRISEYAMKFADLLLKVNCYHAAAVWDGESWEENPCAERLEELLLTCQPAGYRVFLLPNAQALFTMSGGDLCLTLYHPSGDLLRLVRALAASEGLFVRPGA